MNRIIRNKSDPRHEEIDAVLLHLALCHTVILDPRTGKLNAASPDELALVEGVQKFGYDFKEINKDKIITVDVLGQLVKYKLLNILEFNSDRKRMSVIIRSCETQEISLLTKGADAIIEPLLDQSIYGVRS